MSSLQVRLQNKDSDIYKMEQLLLRLNHSVDQANRDRDCAKNETEQAKIHAVRLEEKITYLDR